MTASAHFLDRPHDPDLLALYELWRAKRGTRPMPARAEMDPAEFPRLLANILVIEAGPAGGPHKVRLAGEELVRFSGRTVKGLPAGTTMTPAGSAAYTKLLDQVVATRSPVFRAGAAYWSPDKAHKRFEACFLPLSADGVTVNLILGAVKLG